MILHCQDCSAMVNAEIVKGYHRGDPDEGPTEQVVLLRCPSCSGPFVIVREDLGGGDHGPVTVLLPIPSRFSRALPNEIQNAIAEADACYRAKAFTAAAIMCRKTLEGLCEAHGTTGKTLVANLRELKDNGIIEHRLYEWADALRISGNEAAHDVKITVSAEDARDLLEFTNAILEYVFTFRDKFEAFKQRRQKQPKQDV